MTLSRMSAGWGRRAAAIDALQSKEEELCAKLQGFIDGEVVRNMHSWYRENSLPRSVFQKAAESDLFGFVRSGGTWEEASAFHSVVVQQGLAEVSPGLAVSILAHESLGLLAIHRFGTDAQKERYFLPGVRGEKIAAFANTEPGAGSDASGIALQARKTDGGYVLNGTKMFITNGTVADMLVVSAVTDPEAGRAHEGISLFVVEPESLTRLRIRKKVWAPADLATLQFKDVFVPAHALLGAENQGFKLVMNTFNSSRIAISALTVGTSLGAFKLAYKRAVSRQVFGQRIIDHQAKAYEFADMWSRLEAARMLVANAAWLKEMGEDYTMAASTAKLFACRETYEITRFAAEVFGASGIIEDNPINRFPLDAWAAALGEGTNDIQKRVIAAEMMKRWP